jgi:hypothetical protein
MSDLYDLLGLAAGPPPQEVPSVRYYPAERRRRVVGDCRPCVHCAMNQERWKRRPASIPQWRTKHDVVTCHAVVLITNPDGSALGLCAQHVREYDEKRGDRNG